jgi:hypothetical protein
VRPEATPPPPPPPPLPPPQEPQPFQPPYATEEEEEPAADATPYTARFQLILGALLGIAAVAVIAALLVGSGDLEIADLPVRLALSDPAAGRISVLNGDGVMYTLCGLGPKCSIDTGKPSAQRHLLLRREALELALYTFRYVDDVDYVVALLPPRKGQDATQAMFFRKGDVERELDRPLTRTLPAPPPTTETLNAADISTLESLTAKRLFQFKFEQGQDASVFLVLQPFAG